MIKLHSHSNQTEFDNLFIKCYYQQLLNRVWVWFLRVGWLRLIMKTRRSWWPGSYFMIMFSKKFKCWIIICCRIINYKHIFKRFHGHVNIDINYVAYCNSLILFHSLILILILRGIAAGWWGEGWWLKNFPVKLKTVQVGITLGGSSVVFALSLLKKG